MYYCTEYFFEVDDAVDVNNIFSVVVSFILLSVVIIVPIVVCVESIVFAVVAVDVSTGFIVVCIGISDVVSIDIDVDVVTFGCEDVREEKIEVDELELNELTVAELVVILVETFGDNVVDVVVIKE